MFTREIVTDISIAAPPERVWAVLTNFTAYPAWSPFVRSITGELRTGGRITVSMSPDGEKEFRFRPVLRVVAPGRELRWLGRLGVPFLFDGEHRFVLAPDGAGGGGRGDHH